MANVKDIKAASAEGTGLTTYVIVKRLSDGFLLNDADGSFAAAPVDPYLSLVEDGIIKGVYQVSEARTVWLDGVYSITAYEQVGGAPVPATDIVMGFGDVSIESDLEINPFTQEVIISDTNTLVNTNLDATVSSRSTFDSTVDDVEVGSFTTGALTDLFNFVVEGPHKVLSLLRYLLALCGGKTTGANTDNAIFKSQNGLVNRIDVTTDAGGNRTDVNLDDSD